MWQLSKLSAFSSNSLSTIPYDLRQVWLLVFQRKTTWQLLKRGNKIWHFANSLKNFSDEFQTITDTSLEALHSVQHTRTAKISFTPWRVLEITKNLRYLGSWEVDCVWNVMAHAQKPDFVFRRNGRVHLNRWGRQFSRLLAAEVCASAVIMLDKPCSEVVWRVLAAHYIRQFSLYFPSRVSPCAITFQLDSTSTHENCI